MYGTSFCAMLVKVLSENVRRVPVGQVISSQRKKKNSATETFGQPIMYFAIVLAIPYVSFSPPVFLRTTIL